VKTIIFEDNYIAAMSLQLMVEQMSYEVCNFYDSADDIVSIFEKEPVNFVLMDIQLKGRMTGIEAMEELRRHSQVPVIFMTGNNSKKTADRIKVIGHAELIPKPFTELDVREKLVKMGLRESD